jgi:hypothetical protein
LDSPTQDAALAIDVLSHGKISAGRALPLFGSHPTPGREGIKEVSDETDEAGETGEEKNKIQITRFEDVKTTFTFRFHHTPASREKLKELVRLMAEAEAERVMKEWEQEDRDKETVLI